MRNGPVGTGLGGLHCKKIERMERSFPMIELFELLLEVHLHLFQDPLKVRALELPDASFLFEPYLHNEGIALSDDLDVAYVPR